VYGLSQMIKATRSVPLNTEYLEHIGMMQQSG